MFIYILPKKNNNLKIIEKNCKKLALLKSDHIKKWTRYREIAAVAQIVIEEPSTSISVRCQVLDIFPLRVCEI